MALKNTKQQNLPLAQSPPEIKNRGQLICKANAKWIEPEWDDWAVHPNGSIILRRGNLFTMDGVSGIYRGPFDDWRPHHDCGLLIRIGNKFINPLHNRIMYVGSCDDWRASPKGVVIRRGDSFLLNGKVELYQGPWEEWDIQPYTGDFCFRFGPEFFIGGREEYFGTFDGWDVCRRGLVIRQYDHFLLDGKTQLYTGQYHGWRAHPNGVAIRWHNEWWCYNGKAY